MITIQYLLQNQFINQEQYNLLKPLTSMSIDHQIVDDDIPPALENFVAFLLSCKRPVDLFEMCDENYWPLHKLEQRVCNSYCCLSLLTRLNFKDFSLIMSSNKYLAAHFMDFHKLTDLPKIEGLSEVVNGYFNHQLQIERPRHYINVGLQNMSVEDLRNSLDRKLGSGYKQIVRCLLKDAELRNAFNSLSLYDPCYKPMIGNYRPLTAGFTSYKDANEALIECSIAQCVLLRNIVKALHHCNKASEYVISTIF